MADNYVEVSQKFDRNLRKYSLKLQCVHSSEKHNKWMTGQTLKDSQGNDIYENLKYTISELKVLKQSDNYKINNEQITNFCNFSDLIIGKYDEKANGFPCGPLVSCIPVFSLNSSCWFNYDLFTTLDNCANLYYFTCSNYDLKYDEDEDKEYSYEYSLANVAFFTSKPALEFYDQTSAPCTKLDDGTRFARFSKYADKAVYVIRNLKDFDKNALSKTCCSLTPFFIGIPHSQYCNLKITKDTIDSSFKVNFGKPKFLPNTESFKKPKDSKNTNPKDDDINPSYISDKKNEITKFNKKELEEYGVLTLTSNNTKDSEYFIQVDKIEENVFKFYKIYNEADKNYFSSEELQITIDDNNYPIIVDNSGNLLYQNTSGTYSVIEFYEDTFEAVPHHYPSNTITKLQKISTSNTESADDDNKAKDDDEDNKAKDDDEDKKYQTPFEYYNNLKKSENTEILINETKGYKKINIITDILKKPIVQQKEIPTWFWLDTLKNWCLFRSGNNNNIFTHNSLYVWNGYDGWMNFDKIIRLYQKDKTECRKKSLYDFEEMNLIFSQSWSDTFYDTDMTDENDEFAYSEKYGIMFKSIKLIGENNYNNHDFETFQNITSKVEYDKDDYDVRRYTIFKGCPNIVRSGNNELFLHYYLKQNYSAYIMAHLEEITNKTKIFNREFGSSKALEFVTCDKKYKNELIDLQLYNEDYINSICVNTFGDGSDKTIEDDWHHFTFKKTGSSEIPSESFDSIDIFEDSLVDAAPINTSVIDEEPIKIKFSVNNLYTTNTTTEKTDYAERWDK